MPPPEPPDPPTRVEPLPSLGDRVRAAGHRLLPTRALSWLAGRLARCRWSWVKDPLNRAFAARYRLDLEEAEHADPTAYPSLNALFTRGLNPGARPLPADPGALASPCDGTVSAVGTFDAAALLQAKGVAYPPAELLAGMGGEALGSGAYLTLYLSPQDYHRLHAPLDAVLRTERHVPGRLLTVAPPAVRAVPRLFARNERLVTVWDTAAGPMAVVAVGALHVGSIKTTWPGVAEAARGEAAHYPEGCGPRLARGDELGRFNLGSTVILLLPHGSVRWRADLAPGRRVAMGEPVGELEGASVAPTGAGEGTTGPR